MCEIEIGNLKTRHSRNWFRYETFIHLFEFKGFSTWGERDTIFLCWLLLHRQLSTQPTRGARSAQIRLASTSPESQPSSCEARTQLLCWLFHLPPPPRRAVPSRKLLVWYQRAPKVNLLLPRRELNSLLFLKSQPTLPVRDVTHIPGLNCYLGFLFWHLWMTHPLRARVNTCVNVTPN